MVYIVAVTGYPSSGKSVAKEIANNIGYTTVSMGDKIRKKTKQNWTKRLNDSKKSESTEKPSMVYSSFATKMREKNGQGIVAKWCLEDIKEYNNPVFLDGIRSPKSKEIFEEFTQLDLLYINAPASLRLKWIRNRGRDCEDRFTCKEFLDRDRTENEWGLNQLINNSDYTIHNCTDIETYKQNVRILLHRLYRTNQ